MALSLKVTHKLLLSFTLVALLVASLGYLVFVTSGWVGERVGALDAEALSEVERMHGMAFAAQAAQAALQEIAGTNARADDEATDPAATAREALGGQIAAFERHLSRAQEQATARSFVDSVIEIGLVTLEDILEEIVGEFTTDLLPANHDIHPQPDGTHVIDASVALRDINRQLGWQLPEDGPKTLNGLITERLEHIPDTSVGLTIGNYRMEILQTKDNMIKSVRLWPRDADPKPEGD